MTNSISSRENNSVCSLVQLECRPDLLRLTFPINASSEEITRDIDNWNRMFHNQCLGHAYFKNEVEPGVRSDGTKCLYTSLYCDTQYEDYLTFGLSSLSAA